MHRWLARMQTWNNRQARTHPCYPPTDEEERIRFSNFDQGVRSHGDLYALQVLRTQPLPSGATVTTISVPTAFIAGAPEGRLDGMESLFSAMAGSIEINPEYQANCLESSARIMVFST